MKPGIVIVDSDIVRAGRAVDNAYRTYAAAEANARERRLELGRALIDARRLFPATGRNAGGWSKFIAERGINMDVALDAMKYAGYVEEHQPGYVPGNSDPDTLPTRIEAGIDRPAGKGSAAAGALFISPANVHGGSGEKPRGAYCTPKKWAIAVGPWDLDPFSNPRSHIEADHRCMLEDGGDGLIGPAGGFRASDGVPRVATPSSRVWIQPPYDIVEEAVSHYGHTRFCALLRFAPDTDWFSMLWPSVRVLAVPRERIPFEAPGGIEADGAPFPHVLYYADERDVTAAVRELCIVLRVEHSNV